MLSLGTETEASNSSRKHHEEDYIATDRFDSDRRGLYAGRMTAPAPRYEPSQTNADDPLDAAFEGFIQAQRDTLALYKTHSNFDDLLARAEAYRGLLYTIVGSIKAGALTSHDYPRTMRGVDWTSKAGLDNPDNNYFFALLDDEGTYRLTAAGQHQTTHLPARNRRAGGW